MIPWLSYSGVLTQAIKNIARIMLLGLCHQSAGDFIVMGWLVGRSVRFMEIVQGIKFTLAFRLNRCLSSKELDSDFQFIRFHEINIGL